MASVQSYTDATYAISDDLPATYDAAGYAATTVVFTVIDKVQSFPGYGAARPTQEFRPINGPVEVSKGAPSYGGGEMVMGYVEDDAGQVLLKAAEGSAAHYSMKVTYPDGEIHYLDVINTSFNYSPASEGAFRTATANIMVQKDPVVVPAT
jgi:hypothetical protein